MAKVVVDPRTKAKRLMVDLALSMTKMDSEMRKACRLVMVDGKRMHQAAKAVKRPRQHVYRALKSLAPHFEAVRKEVEAHGAKL